MPSENSAHCDPYGTRSIHKQRICSLWHAMVAMLCAILGLPTLLVTALAPVYDSSRILVPTPSISLVATKTDPKSGITPVFKDTPEQCLNKQVPAPGLLKGDPRSIWVQDLGFSYYGKLFDTPTFHEDFNQPTPRQDLAALIRDMNTVRSKGSTNFVLAKLTAVYKEKLGEEELREEKTSTAGMQTAPAPSVSDPNLPLSQKRPAPRGTEANQKLVKTDATLSSSSDAAVTEEFKAADGEASLPPRYVHQELSGEFMGFCFRSGAPPADLTESGKVCQGWKAAFGNWLDFEEFLKSNIRTYQRLQSTATVPDDGKSEAQTIEEIKKQGYEIVEKKCANGVCQITKQTLNALAYAHSEQALLGSYYADAKRCLAGLKNPNCKLYRAAFDGGWSDHICDIELFILDVISYPNSVCSNCDTSFITADFVHMYNQALNEECKSRDKNLKTRLVVRTSSYNLFKPFRHISCAGLNYNTRINDFIAASDSITLHLLPHITNTALSGIRAECNRVAEQRPCNGDLFEQIEQQTTTRTTGTTGTPAAAPAAAAGSDE